MRNLLILVLLCHCTLYGTTKVCDSGWFGARCQYKCHCMNGQQCDQYGICPDLKCASGWFGPACQYVDLAATNSSGSLNILIDNNDTSCITAPSISVVNITLDTAYPFTWLRLHVKDPSLLYNLTVKFSNNSAHSLECENERRAVVSDKTLDIHCELNVTVTKVILEGEGVKALCSLYISGGCNIALKENVKQSSDYKKSTADLAVDGSVGLHEETCTHTGERDRSPSWTLTFPQLRFVTRYILYNRHEFICSVSCLERLKRFNLISYGKDRSIVFNYTDQESTGQFMYTVIQIPWQKPVSSVVIYANKGQHQLYLSLCEVEVFGDVVCEKGKYGRECLQTCNCANNESCFCSTGGCPDGCAPGFRGENCHTGCTNNTYGAECRMNCSEICKVNNTAQPAICDHVTGLCLYGCVDGKYGDELKFDDSELKGRLLIYVGAAASFVAIIVVIVIVCYKVKSRDYRLQIQSIYDHTEARYDNNPYASMLSSDEPRGISREAGMVIRRQDNCKSTSTEDTTDEAMAMNAYELNPENCEYVNCNTCFNTEETNIDEDMDVYELVKENYDNDTCCTGSRTEDMKVYENI